MWLIGLILFSMAMVLSAYFGYWYRTKEEEGTLPSFSRDYLTGINFIINDETDKAVDHFIKMLAVDSDTVETHFALGKLFRRRGEVDRAIRIHQNLIARPTLENHYRDQAFFALGCDYLSGGMLDRAERIFLDLVKEKALLERALKMLLDIYQQEKAWHKAIDIATQYQMLTKENQSLIIGHFYCELAELCMHKHLADALSYIEHAIAVDPESERAYLLQGKCFIQQKNYQHALHSLKAREDKSKKYFAEVLPLIVTTYEALQLENELQTYLQDVAERYPSVSILNVFASVLQKKKGDMTAAAFVKDYVRQHPSMSGVVLYLQLTMSSLQGQTRDDLFLLQKIMKKMLGTIARYKCVSCGFSGNTLHWLCPGCKQWSSTLPLLMYEETPVQ